MSVVQSAGAAAQPAPRVLFSSGQIVFSTILLGPLPPLHMLASNLRVMGKGSALRKVVIGGYALIMSEIVILCLLPGRSGGSLFLGLNTGLATYAFMYQPDWSAISRSDGYVRAGLGRVLWVCVVRVLECLVWAFGIFTLLDVMGLMSAK